MQSDAGRDQMLQQIELTAVRTPYPSTAPAMRELDIVNRSPASVLQVTVGWLEGSARGCPASRSAYHGTRDLYVSLKTGQSATTMGEFSEHARYFCILAAQFLGPDRSSGPPPAAPPEAPTPTPPPSEPTR